MVATGDADVTVIIPTRNRLPLLRLAVHSALNQRGVDVRVLIVDDGSQDNTVEVMEAHEDPRVRILGLGHSGHPARVRNAGLAQATTPFVAFLDDDDLWSPDKLRLQLAALASAGEPGWSGVGALHFRSPGHRICGALHTPSADALFPDLLRGNTIPGGGSGVVAATDLLRSLGGFAEDIPRSEDWDMWVRLAARAPFVPVDLPLVGYRVAAQGRANQQSLATNRTLHRWMAERHHDLRSRYSVAPPSETDLRLNWANTAARAGRRKAAVAEYLTVGIRHRRPGSVAFGIAAGVDPRLAVWIREQRLLAKVDRQWIDSGWSWLEPMLAASDSG